PQRRPPAPPPPLPPVLLGATRPPHRPGRLPPARADPRRGLGRALELACHPHRLARQFARERRENPGVGAITVEVALAVDAAAVRHRRVPDPPPLRRAHGRPL